MLLLYLSVPIFASLLFQQADAKWNGIYVSTIYSSCFPNPCIAGYKCDVDEQGTYCYRLGQGIRPSSADYTFNVDSNNRFVNNYMLNWILRLIKLLGRTFNQRSTSDKNGDDMEMPDADQTSDKNGDDMEMPDADQTSNNNGGDNEMPDADQTSNNNGGDNEMPDADQTSNNNGGDNEMPDADQTSNNNGGDNEMPDADQTSTENGNDIDTSSTEETTEPTQTDSCDPNPCENEGTCTVDMTTMRATCECKYPTGGNKCQEELGGCKDCARKGQLVLFLMNDKSYKSFEKAKQVCKDDKNGLTMFTPKTKELYEFGRDFMQKSTPPDMKVAYWIGATRKNRNETFKWIDDGTEVKSPDWINKTYLTSEYDHCADLYSNVGKEKRFGWNNNACAHGYISSYDMRPACTGTFAFLPKD